MKAEWKATGRAALD